MKMMKAYPHHHLHILSSLALLHSSQLHFPQLFYLVKPGVAKMMMAREIVTLEAKALSC